MSGLLAAMTTIGVYNATAGSAVILERPVIRQSNPVAAKVETGSTKVIRIVGPQFLPDNSDIKLLGAANERVKRG